MRHEVVVTGAGVVSAIGSGKGPFLEALLSGESRFNVMNRLGRQCESAFIGAEIQGALAMPFQVATLGGQTSLSAWAALSAAKEAIDQSGLEVGQLSEAALFLGGGNLQQRELLLMQERYRSRPQFMSPSYGQSFQDTDIAAICCEAFGIKGAMLVVNGASASGLLAIVQAAESIANGCYERCLVIGALQDISHWEAQALTNMGAMAHNPEGGLAQALYRPFDRNRRGFVYGEGCAALVLERASRRSEGHARPLAKLSGWAVVADGSRTPAASQEAEVNVIRRALIMAALPASLIDYVNPHGSGSLQGDEVELRALKEAGLSRAYINSTKSMTGHALAAAGALETVATILQMEAGMLHPSKNLEHPIDEDFNWVREKPVESRLANSLKLSFGFGGINVALCLSGIQ